MNSLAVQSVVLWSDALLFLLLFATLALVYWARGESHLRAAWRRVMRDRIALISATVLSCFLLIGMLDSLHYRARLPAALDADGNARAAEYAVEVHSVLDALLSSMRARTEKTYSAPLATHLYSKETVEATQAREFPRLQHGGRHLGEALDRHRSDVLQTVLRGVAAGVAIWLLLAVVLRSVISLAPSAPMVTVPSSRVGDGMTALDTVLATLFVIALLLGPVFALAADYHVLGTDKVGQDVLYLSLKSVRTGLLIGTLTTLVMLPLAVLLGILAGYAGGWIDDVIQYLYTTLNSIPGVLLIAAAVLMMQVVIDTHPQWFATSADRADARLLALCLILGMTSWTGVARLLRGETLKLRELEFVQAARAFGVGRFTIMWRHIVPNLMHIVLIALVMDFSGLVLAEAVLSYVGVGVDPSTISFGTMINAARMELAREPMVWWSLVAAFGFMFTLVLAANLFADAVRDAFDPRLIHEVRDGAG
jgi:peptide/nickel transport system permease protein